jgi:hypothetical protein
MQADDRAHLQLSRHVRDGVANLDFAPLTGKALVSSLEITPIRQ